MIRPIGLNCSMQASELRAAKKAGLRYVNDASPGIHRRRTGAGFVYVDAKGQRISGKRGLQRIRSLAIPPAYADVWICPDPLGHIQATGRDARGRKQYKYHPDWRAARDQSKFARMADFANALPRIRRQVARDLRKSGLGRDKVLASVVRLLESTFIRIGNEQYKRENNSYGLTTLRARHVDINGQLINFEFRGKGGKPWKVRLADPRLARVIRSCQDLPGQELFQYVDGDGLRRRVGSEDVNAYIREAAGDDFTAKDFRTWAGSVLASMSLRQHLGHASAKRCVKRVIEEVAARLGNTAAICRKCYIHPVIIEAFLSGRLGRVGRSVARRGLSRAEAAILTMIARR